jgi:hypothetical protein
VVLAAHGKYSLHGNAVFSRSRATLASPPSASTRKLSIGAAGTQTWAAAHRGVIRDLERSLPPRAVAARGAGGNLPQWRPTAVLMRLRNCRSVAAMNTVSWSLQSRSRHGAGAAAAEAMSKPQRGVFRTSETYIRQDFFPPCFCTAGRCVHPPLLDGRRFIISYVGRPVTGWRYLFEYCCVSPNEFDRKLVDRSCGCFIKKGSP